MSISAPPRTPASTPGEAHDAPLPQGHEPDVLLRPRRTVSRGWARALFEEAWRRARRRRALAAAVSMAAVAVVVVVLGPGQPDAPSVTFAEGLVTIESGPVQAPAPLGENGTLATVGAAAADAATDIYLFDPGRATPRQLTSTPGLDEYAPSWSPDGSRLAFIRSDQPTPSAMQGFANAAACVHVCDLVLMDAVSGATVLTLGIAHAGAAGGGDTDSMVPASIEWAPSGQALLVDLSWCGIGGCGGRGPLGSILVDLRSGRPMETPPGVNVLGWSPDGRWLTLVDGRAGSPAVVAVPAGHVDEVSLDDVALRDGAVVLADPRWSAIVVDWSPDSSAILLNEGMIYGAGPDEEWRPASIDVVTVPDGRRRTIIADGAQPIVSPDGRHIAYLTGYGIDHHDDGILTDIWVADLDGTHARRIARSATVDSWSPDGQLLVARDERSWFTIDVDSTSRTDLAVVPAGDGVPWGPTAAWQRVPVAN